MLQSCDGSNIDPDENNDLVDVNPVAEEDEPDAEDDDDSRDDEREADNERIPADSDDEIEGGLYYDIGEENDLGYELE